MGIWPHSENFRAWEWDYPNSAELEQRANELLALYDIDKKAPIQPEKGTVSAENTEVAKQEDPNTVSPVNEVDTVTIDQTAKTIICSNCHEELPVKSRFCNMCGMKV